MTNLKDLANKNVNFDNYKSELHYKILKEYQEHIDEHGNYILVSWDAIFDSLVKKRILSQKDFPKLKRIVTGLSSNAGFLIHYNGSEYRLSDDGNMACDSWDDDFKGIKKSFWKNPWVIGIITSILGGIIVGLFFLFW